MIISLGLDGKINSILPENIYQGSNKINTIVIVAPFSSTSIIDIQFELPNGKITEPFILDRTSKINEEINTWSLDVTSALTQFKGVVRYNVRALSNGETIATAKGSFKIIEGVDFELPETPEQNVYEVLLNKVSNIETKTEETRSMSEQAQAKAETALENSNYAIFQIEGAIENSQKALETANSISGTANTALELADDANKKANTIDEKIANLVNSAPETLDTLGELAKAITDNQEVVDALNDAIINKADKTEIPTLTSQLTNNSGFITKDEIPKGALLYPGPGNNTDGAMTQKATTDYFVQKGTIPDGEDIMDLSSNQKATGNKYFDTITVNKISQTDGNSSIYSQYENQQIFGGSYNTVVMGQSVTLDSVERPKWYNFPTGETKELAMFEEIPDTSKFVTVNDIYPVGSIYLTVATDTTGAVSPASFLGGTWERLPEGYSLWTASEGAGDTIDAGLPNITGTFCGGDSNILSGAFTSSAKNGSKVGSGSAEFRTFTFKASASNSIYGNSTTVQPPAIKVYAWKRIA